MSKLFCLLAELDQLISKGSFQSAPFYSPMILLAFNAHSTVAHKIQCTNKTCERIQSVNRKRSWENADHFLELRQQVYNSNGGSPCKIYYFVHAVSWFCSLRRKCTYSNANQKLWHKTGRTNVNLQEAAVEKEYQQISCQREYAVLWLVWAHNVTSHKGEESHQFYFQMFLRCFKCFEMCEMRWHGFKHVIVGCRST